MTGEHSGLENPNMPTAFADMGITTFAADASRQVNPYTITGTSGTTSVTAHSSPRYPSNIYYNASNWVDELNEYNTLYVAEGDSIGTGSETGRCANTSSTTCLTTPATETSLLASESRIELGHVLNDNPRVTYAHQSNLIGPNYTLLTLLSDILGQYNTWYSSATPYVQTTDATSSQILSEQATWAAANTAGTVSASNSGGIVTITNNGTSSIAVPVTAPVGSTSGGAAFGTPYGDTFSAWEMLAAGASLTIDVVVPAISAITPDLAPMTGLVQVTVSGSGFSTTAGATTFSFGSTAASSVSCSSATTCTALVPAASGPGEVDVTATVGSITSADSSFTYYSPGLLRVTTSPAVPSQITVDGSIADTWGLNWVKEPPGEHTVCFSAVQGFATPSCQVVSVTSGETNTVTGTFVEHGYLQVQTSPPVAGEVTVTATGSSTIVAMDDWGLYTDLAAGSYTVCFGAVAGYAPPACQPTTVTAGATTTITGDYTVSAGATGQSGVGLLRVTTSPALPSQITVDGSSADTWGLNWLEIAPGEHTVCFSALQGYTTPACQDVMVTAGATSTVTGTFTETGFLQVQTSPPVAGTVYLNGQPTDDWGLYTDLPAGAYSLCFGAVPGYTAPPCQSATVTAGSTTEVTGIY